VTLHLDVSGFTKLCETLAQKENGADELSKHLNNYLAQMVKRIAKNGGDICKFAGDAIIVIWPLEESMDVRCLRAAQSALEIHECLDQLVMGDGISLRVKIGIGVGNLDIVHIGGEADSCVSQRMEYVALGEALVQSFHAENHSQPALTIVSNSVVKLLADSCAYADIEEGGKCTLAYCNGSKPGVRLSTSKDVKWPCKFKKLEKILNPVRSKTLVPNALRMQELSMNTGMNTNIWKYIALSVAPFLDEEHETWGNELRRVSTVFMNLGISMEYLNSSSSINKEACNKLQNVFATVQKEIFDKEGTINKFLVDDKGSTLVAAFGLPPLAHENDAIRAVLASLALFSDVKAKFKLKLSIGITTSMVFTGVVGHRGHRREYSLLGDGVNLAARFMQEANKKHVGILVCHNTKLSCGSSIKFSFPNEITVKGKSVMTPVYQPLPPTEMLSQMNVKVSRSQFYSLRQLKVRQSKLLSEIQSISQTNLLATVPSKGGADGSSPAEVTPSSAPSLRGSHTSTLVYDEDARMWKEISEPLDMVQLKTMNRGAFAEGTSERRAEQDKSKKNFMVGEKANLLAKGIERRRSSLLSIHPEELHSEVMRRSSDSFRTSSEDDQRHSTDSEAHAKERDLLFDEDRDFSKSRLESSNRAKFSFQKANSIYSSKSGSASDAFANVANRKIVALHIQYRSRTGDVTEITIPVLDDSQTIEDVRKKALLYLQRKGFPGKFFSLMYS
jgi:class 3 adenylate cyclase